MGTPIDCSEPLFEPGDDCPACTPDVWLPGKTPTIITIYFRNLDACPGNPIPPNDYGFKVPQIAPCAWQLIDAPWYGHTWSIHYVTNIDDLETFLELTQTDVAPAVTYFRYQNAPMCQPSESGGIIGPNVATCALGQAAEGGEANLYWQPDDIPRILTCSYHMQPLAGTLFERTPCGIDHQIIRLANRSDKTNILILIDNEDFT